MRNRTKPKIKIGQVWKSRLNDFQLLVTGKKGDMWQTKTLTEKAGVYGDTHTMSTWVLWHRFEIIA